MKNFLRFTLLAATAALAACATSPSDREAAEEARLAARPLPVLASAPLDENRTLTRIAFGSCNDQDNPQGMWNSVAAADPDLFLFIGDNVYGDLYRDDDGYGNPDLPKLRAAYQGLAASQPFTQLRNQTPILPVWDDHDYGLNDGGAAFIHREEAEAIFETVWDVPETDERARRPGIYQSWTVGEPGKRVQIIMLDTRFFKSEFMPSDDRGAPGKERYIPDTDTAKTMLGAAQWRWLAQELKKPADLRLVISSLQVIADGHGWEAWKMLPAERQRLYDTFNAAGAENIILLSGDRHAAGLYRKDLVLTYPLYEATSSSLNAPVSAWREEGDTYVEPGPNRMGGMYEEANFGLVDIDWEGESVTLSIVNDAGEPVRAETIALSALRPVY